mgnify:CR=1 FL=1
MKKFLFLLLAVTAGTAPAQTLVYPGEHEMPPVPKTFDNELGVRYGAQLYVGDGRGPELQAFSIDYARYNFYNIGFRTGLNAIHLADRTYRLVLAPGEPGAERAE